MKPIKLTVTAFGPYKDTQVIDFNKLEHHRIFVISGNTGAGKTTIFDAVCYALYGTASGEDRAEFRTLRSHFADENVHTAVELQFSVKGKVYRVFRQMKHRKGNNKSETGDKIELYETTAEGKEVPAVDRFVIQDVNQKLVNIIGLTKDQFSQIVMLPQGEFRKLLTSSTDNKEEILRKIFRTEKFERLEQLVGQKYKSKVEQVKEQLAEQQALFTQTKELFTRPKSEALKEVFAQPEFNTHQLVQALIYEEEANKQLIIQLEEEKKKVQQDLANSRQTLLETEQMNEKVVRRDQLQERLVTLQQEQVKVAEWKERLQFALRAVEVSWVQKAKQEAEQRLNSSKVQLAEKQTQLVHLKHALEQAQQAFIVEQQKEEQKKLVANNVQQLEQLIPLVQEMKQLEQQVNEAETKSKHEQANLKLLQQQYQQCRDQIKTLKSQVEQYQQAKFELVQLATKKEETLRQGKLVSKVIELFTDYHQLFEFEKEESSQYEALHGQYTTLEASWINAQASILASHLHDGEACPVCGSLSHPEKAMLKEQAPTKDQLDEFKRRLDAKQHSQLETQAKLTTTLSQLHHYADELTEATLSQQLKAMKAVDMALESDFLAYQQQLRLNWKELQTQFEHLEKLSLLFDQAKQQLEEQEQHYEKLEIDMNRSVQQVEQLNLTFNSAQVKLLELQSRIPSHMNYGEDIEGQYREQKRLLEQLEWAYKQAEAAVVEEDKRYASLISTIQFAQEQVVQFEEAYREAMTQFNAKLAEHGFHSEEHYLQYQLSEQQLEQLKANIQAYEQEVLKLNHDIEQLNASLKDYTFTSTETIKLHLQQFEQLFEGILKDEAGLQQLRSQTLMLIKKLDTLASQMSTVEQEVAMIHDLFLTIKGDNRLKLSYERYVLIDYLEQIIVMANLRLKKLTNGQFELRRSDRLETNGKQSGLGLDVYDSYTGQNRDVKSLSGGEKFNASLCLALGMTDVIQSSQGGVSIEMMFIDEGFGSLDEESLQKAIATLIDLQKAGRMIGVISHVQELKDALDACLEVSKTRDGHAKAQFVLKR